MTGFFGSLTLALFVRIVPLAVLIAGFWLSLLPAFGQQDDQLQSCQANSNLLANEVLRLRARPECPEPANPTGPDPVEACQKEAETQKRLNIQINNELARLKGEQQQCEEPGQIASLQAQVVELEASLAQRAAELEAYKDRLDALGATLVPSFSYQNNDPFVSFVTRSGIANRADVPLAAQCDEALSWLQALKDADLPVDFKIWVDDAARMKICALQADGSFAIQTSGRADEAHALVFR